MIVVADASPIIVLVNIQLADLLPTLFGRVIVPDAVALELASARRPDPVRSFIASPPVWLEVRTPKTVAASFCESVIIASFRL